MMWFLPTLLLTSQVAVTLAAPSHAEGLWTPAVRRALVLPLKAPSNSASRFSSLIQRQHGNQTAAVGTAGTAAAGEAAGAAAGEAAGAVVENNVNGAFGQAIQLGGGNVKTDVLFTKSATGSLEVEFQNQVGRTLTVTENKTPAAPPAGFTALEASSYQINLAEGADGLTLQKVDYVLDVTNANVAAQDISQGQIGKLCTETNTFVIDPAIGELEFEAEENELSLTVDNMNGEWGVFIPQAAANANAGNVNAGNANAGNANAGNSANVGNAGNAGNVANAGEAENVGIGNAVNAGNGNAAAPATGEAEAGAEAEVQENNINGAFDTAVPVQGGNLKTDVLFTQSPPGSLELEHSAATANTITVTQNASPPAPPPPGFLLVDPTTFQIKTQTPPNAANAATDLFKVDYIFTPAVKAAVDVSQGVIGKLDVAANVFVTEGVGEFEFEEEEDEWSLTVGDLNGEWAVLVPMAAVL